MTKVSGSARLKELLVLFCVMQLCMIVILLAKRDLDKPKDSEIRDNTPFRMKLHHSRQNQLEPGRAPPVKYEKAKRRLRSVVEELWHFMGYQMKTLHEDIRRNRTPEAERVAKILDQGIEYKRIILQEIEKLSEVDGYNTWRSREANDLSDLVQRRLRFLQNPKNCRNARKLVCNLKKACGFGCQLHHIVYCLMTAYSSQRTMILISQGWEYNEIGWESVFQPLSNNCNGVGSGICTPWKGFNDRNQVVNLPIVELFEGNHPYLPRAVPKDLAERISNIHEVPVVWWVGQFVKYLMRLQPSTNNMIIEATRNMKFKHPIVGVHIRRTDKLNSEAAYHSVAEYMNNVEEYYAQLCPSRKAEIKRIYLASDDVTVFEEIRMKYPDYTVVGNRNISEMTAKKRYCSECLNGLIVDIYLLANSDFLVCTFSSQVRHIRLWIFG